MKRKTYRYKRFSKKEKNSILANMNSSVVYLPCAHTQAMSREGFKPLHFIIHAIHYLYDIKRYTL